MYCMEATKETRSVFSPMGATAHSKTDRQAQDFYASDPRAVRGLLHHGFPHCPQTETFSPDVWECACGEGHLSTQLEAAGFTVHSSDKYDRGFGDTVDFFSIDQTPCDIITNPPYDKKLPAMFLRHAMEILRPRGGKVAFLLRLLWAESVGRYKLFTEFPPKKVVLFSYRLNCPKDGDFQKHNGSAVCYAWFIWEKGWTEDTQLCWV